LRAWDEFDAYLFDIDGTLINCRDAVHYFAFCESLTRIAGRPMNLDGVVAHGNTDAGRHGRVC
jgi:phosphoglycolate phosphatase